MRYLVQVGEEVRVVAPQEVGPRDVVRVGHDPVKEAVFLWQGGIEDKGKGHR